VPGSNTERATTIVVRFEQVGDDRGTTPPSADGLAGQIFGPDPASSWFESVHTDHGRRRSAGCNQYLVKEAGGSRICSALRPSRIMEGTIGKDDAGGE